MSQPGFKLTLKTLNMQFVLQTYTPLSLSHNTVMALGHRSINSVVMPAGVKPH